VGGDKTYGFIYPYPKYPDPPYLIMTNIFDLAMHNPSPSSPSCPEEDAKIEFDAAGLMYAPRAW
jgi:hypothetical protein